MSGNSDGAHAEPRLPEAVKLLHDAALPMLAGMFVYAGLADTEGRPSVAWRVHAGERARDTLPALLDAPSVPA